MINKKLPDLPTSFLVPISSKNFNLRKKAYNLHDGISIETFSQHKVQSIADRLQVFLTPDDNLLIDRSNIYLYAKFLEPEKVASNEDWSKIMDERLKKMSYSIQFRVIELLKKNEAYGIIFDDDGKGEIADVVAIIAKKDCIQVELYHCKFSIGKEPGARSDDLYVICGQAQKSIHWKEHSTRFFTRLLKRETARINETGINRIEKGNIDKLYEIKEMSRYLPIKLKIFIVQPGLSKKKASLDQLRILGVTENYLMETLQLPFGVIASK